MTPMTISWEVFVRRLTVLVIFPTGSGETGLLSMFLIVIRALVACSSLRPTAGKFSKNPAMLVVCPTNYIEHQIVREHACY
jgi:hypothetical protein